MMKKINNRARLLLLFFTFSFLFRTDASFDQDLGRHIKLGEIIWQSKEVPKINLFSYANPDFSFINTHWLFEVIAYGFSQTIGLYWLLIAKVLIFLISVWLIIKTIPKENQVLLLPIGFIFLHVLRERLELRPEIFSFLFTAVTLFILERFLRRGTKWIFLLPFIQLIWINTHIYFFVGLILQVIFLISLGWKLINTGGYLHSNLRILLFVLVLSGSTSLLNPNGIQGVIYPLNVTKNYGYTIVENQTMFLLESIEFSDPNFLFVKLSVGLVALSLLVTSLRKQFEVKNILLALSGVVLALMNVRSFPYLVFLSLPAVLQNFGPTEKNKFFSFLLIVTCALLLLESFFYLNGDYYRYRDDQHQVGTYFTESVKNGMDFVLGQNLPGPIYNNFDIGSYILYRGYPKYQVFIDGRPEAYPASFFQQVYIPTQSDYTKFKGLENKYGFKTIIFSITDQTPWGRNFLQNNVKDEDWNIVYIDDFVTILVKNEVMEQLSLARSDLARLTPDSYDFDNHLSYLRLGIFLLSTGYQDSGKQFILKAREVFPNSPAVNQIMGNQISNKFFW